MMYATVSNDKVLEKEVHIFSDAPKKASQLWPILLPQ